MIQVERNDGCDKFRKQLITLQHAEYQKVI